MRNRPAEPARILLDTSFLLPSLGIETGREVMGGLRKLTDLKADVHYSQFSILESLWVAARLSKTPSFDEDRFRLGLRSILAGRSYRKVVEGPEAFDEALKLHSVGHTDMIDNILYANSTLLDLKLLTVDDQLKHFIRDKQLADTLISPRELGPYRQAST